MSLITAAFLGMGLILLFGLAVLAIAWRSRSSHHSHRERHGH